MQDFLLSMGISLAMQDFLVLMVICFTTMEVLFWLYNVAAGYFGFDQLGEVISLEVNLSFGEDKN